MALKNGSVVEINYTARVADGKVFDTTLEKKAIESGIFNKNTIYKPVPIVLGENEVFKALDEEIKTMEVGKTKKVLLKPEQAFGNRKPELVVVVPLREFKNRNIQPFPGLVVDVNGRHGKVQSVSGGRVRVDFNHPLSGKEIEYELKIEKVLEKPKEKVEALFNKYFSFVPEKERKLKIEKETVEVELPAKFDKVASQVKEAFSRIVTKHVQGIKKVKFVQEFEAEEKSLKETKNK